MEALAIRGVTSLDHRDLIARSYVGEHHTLLLTKYTSCGPHLFKFSHNKSMGAIDPWGMASLDLSGLNWSDICRGPLK